MNHSLIISTPTLRAFTSLSISRPYKLTPQPYYRRVLILLLGCYYIRSRLLSYIACSIRLLSYLYQR